MPVWREVSSRKGVRFLEKFNEIRTGMSKMRERAFRQLFSNEKVKCKSASQKITITLIIILYSRIILIAYKTTATTTGPKQTAKLSLDGCDFMLLKFTKIIFKIEFSLRNNVKTRKTGANLYCIFSRYDTALFLCNLFNIICPHFV